MIPGNPQILKCPHCGGLRRISSIMSGNTCGATKWSDGKIYFPMLPQISEVLRCPVCSKYHFYHPEQIVGECRTWGDENFGYLSYASLKEALKELAPTGEAELSLRMMIHWAYNDLYWHLEDEDRTSAEYLAERKYFVRNAKAIIALRQDDILFCAELYREIGDFKRCVRCVHNFLFDYERKIAADDVDLICTLVRKAEQRDSKVYVVYAGSAEDMLRKPQQDDEGYVYSAIKDWRWREWWRDVQTGFATYIQTLFINPDADEEC